MPTERLGIYIDAVHRRAGERVATDPADFAFVGIFLPEVARRFRSLLLLGRVEPAPDPGHFVVLDADVELVELPYYPGLLSLGQVARAFPRTVATFWRALSRVDTVWVFGPHPFSLVLVGLALLRGKRVALGVRQDTVEYFRSRLPSRRWAPALLPAIALDRAYRLLGRRLPVVVTGPEAARRYGRSRRVHVLTESVVRASEVAEAPHDQPWDGEIELLTVGRLDPEKNPELLVKALAELNEERPDRFRVAWVGGGTMEEPVRQSAEQLGVAGQLDLKGWVPYGPELLDLYRRAHVFVHVSLTEGLPKVLIEALACGTPIVATDVGSVRAALDDGRAGLVVPPDDLESLVAAVRRVVHDEALRTSLVARGLELARERTLETQSERVAEFLLGRN